MSCRFLITSFELKKGKHCQQNIDNHYLWSVSSPGLLGQPVIGTGAGNGPLMAQESEQAWEKVAGRSFKDRWPFWHLPSFVHLISCWSKTTFLALDPRTMMFLPFNERRRNEHDFLESFTQEFQRPWLTSLLSCDLSPSGEALMTQSCPTTAFCMCRTIGLPRISSPVQPFPSPVHHLPRDAHRASSIVFFRFENCTEVCSKPNGTMV